MNTNSVRVRFFLRKRFPDVSHYFYFAGDEPVACFRAFFLYAEIERDALITYPKPWNLHSAIGNLP